MEDRMSSHNSYNYQIYLDGKVRVTINYSPNGRLVVAEVWSVSKKDSILGSWVPFDSKPEYMKMDTSEFMLLKGICLTHIKHSRYSLMRIENKTHNIFVIIDHFLSMKVLGSMFNKSDNELKEDKQIYNFTKYIEKRYGFNC